MALLLPRVSKQQKWPSPAITAATQQHNKATPLHPVLPTLASNTSAKPWRHIQLPPATCLMPVSLILLTQERLLCFSITFHSDHRNHTRDSISLQTTIRKRLHRYYHCQHLSAAYKSHSGAFWGPRIIIFGRIREYVSLLVQYCYCIYCRSIYLTEFLAVFVQSKRK